MESMNAIICQARRNVKHARDARIALCRTYTRMEEARRASVARKVIATCQPSRPLSKIIVSPKTFGPCIDHNKMAA